jgi:DNA-binding SARP family transcriptional activator
MEFRLLGPVAVIDGEREVTVRQRRQRALLALLLLHLGETVSVDRLLEELWGSDAPKTALASLHNAVSQLRRLVGADVLLTRAPGYALEIEPTSVDTVRFEHLLEEAQAARSVQDHGTAAVVLGEALALWHGPALADLAYEPFAQSEIRRLQELRQTALEERIEADLGRGRHEDVVPELEQLVAANPLRERLHGQLMLALYRSGRQADALAAYRAARQTLVDELGIEPGPELRQLEQAVLRQDDALLLPGGTPVAAPAPMQFRRLATILFADVVAATGDGDALDPEAFHRVLERFAETGRVVTARYGGWIDNVAGDALMAAFGAQAADERHALRAAHAALDLRAAVASMNSVGETGLEVRIGLGRGEVLVSAPQARQQFVRGEAVHVAAGLAHAAAAGEIVVGPLAQRLLGAATLEPLGEIALRARPRPVAAFRLVELAAPETTPAQALEGPLVGRKRELKTLRTALREARKDDAPRAITVLGPAGIGKSRLARELAAGARGFDVLGAACPSYGDGITYLPLRQLVGGEHETIRLALGSDPDADTVANRLARLDGPAPEIAWAFRRWCEARVRRRPLLIIVDDLHWAESTFLDLLEHLAEHGEGALVLVSLAREELLAERPRFLDAASNATRLVLDGLATAETASLVDQLLVGAPLPPEALARVFETAEGNPLFVEQLVALAVEGDPLAADRPMPETVHALLAARLDRLGPGERAVLERAAVVGREFTSTDVTSLLDAEAAPTVRRHLATLARRGFIRPRRDGEWRFGHVLLQEATYRASPKALRANLHERYADALDRTDGAPDVVVGTHLERAYQLRAELALPDRAALKVADDAGRRLAAAGLRAWNRHDAPAAANLLGRALALLPPSAHDRPQLLCELGLVLKWMHDEARAESVLREALTLGVDANDERVTVRAELELAWPRLLRGEADTNELLELAERAVHVFRRHSDERGLGRAWMVAAAVHGSFRVRWGECAIAAERAVPHFVASRLSPTPCFSTLASAARQGPEPAPAAARRCERLLADAPEDMVTRRYVVTHLAALYAMRGSFERARALLREARAFDARHQTAPSDDWVMPAAYVETLAGEVSTAETLLREACERFETRGDATWLATFTARLAEALCDQHRFEEAHELTRTATGLAHREDVLVQATWRRTRARTAARKGDLPEALALAREANELLDETDALNERAAARLGSAEVLSLASRHDDAAVAAEEGLALLRQKGNVAGLRRARAYLNELGIVHVEGEERVGSSPPVSG